MPHFLLPDNAETLCLELWWTASSICCVEGQEKDGKYHPFQGFNSLQNVLASLKAAVLAPDVGMVDPKKVNRPFPCHEFQSTYIITVPSLDSIKKES